MSNNSSTLSENEKSNNVSIENETEIKREGSIRCYTNKFSSKYSKIVQKISTNSMTK
jgi:hypothetical protein